MGAIYLPPSWRVTYRVIETGEEIAFRATGESRGEAIDQVRAEVPWCLQGRVEFVDAVCTDREGA